jgi:hypothetical protein
MVIRLTSDSRTVELGDKAAVRSVGGGSRWLMW